MLDGMAGIQSGQLSPQVMVHVGAQCVSDLPFVREKLLEVVKIPSVGRHLGVRDGIRSGGNFVRVAEMIEKSHFANEMIGCQGCDLVRVSLNVNAPLCNKVSATQEVDR